MRAINGTLWNPKIGISIGRNWSAIKKKPVLDTTVPTKVVVLKYGVICCSTSLMAKPGKHNSTISAFGTTIEGESVTQNNSP